jgi:hypothetical protein
MKGPGAALFLLLFTVSSLIAAEKQKIVATFSIVAVDPETGDLGVAVQSKFPNVRQVVPWLKAGVGGRSNPGDGKHGLWREGSGFIGKRRNSGGSGKDSDVDR